MGGYKTEIPVIGYTYFGDGNDPGSEAEVALQQKEQGYAEMKLKVGVNIVSRDIKRVEAVRNAMGDDFILACGANRAWTVDQVLEFALSVVDLDLACLEELVRWHNEVDGMSRVRSSGQCRPKRI